MRSVRLRHVLIIVASGVGASRDWAACIFVDSLGYWRSSGGKAAGNIENQPNQKEYEACQQGMTNVAHVRFALQNALRSFAAIR